MIFQQTFTISNDGVKADNVTNIIPCSISSAYGYNNYQPTPAEGDEKDQNYGKKSRKEVPGSDRKKYVIQHPQSESSGGIF